MSHVSLTAWRFALLWGAWYGVPFPIPWTIGVEFALFATLAVALSSSLRKQFVLYWTVLRNAEQRQRRIEQLGEEKERLDYEARIASHAAIAASLANHAASDDGASTCSSTAATPAHHIRAIGRQPASAASSESDAWPRSLELQIRAAGKDGRACQPRVGDDSEGRGGSEGAVMVSTC